jgi:SAM-dependent methyltransferase
MPLNPETTVAPSAWVQRYAKLIRPGGNVLDLACGRGRHTRMLLELGYSVVAADRELAGLADLQAMEGLELRRTDLETPQWPFAADRFAGIVVTNYLYRPHMDAIVTSLAADGILIYATFAKGHEAFGRPRNPDFLLNQDELLTVFGAKLHVVAYEQVIEANPAAVRQRICVAGAAHPVTNSTQ